MAASQAWLQACISALHICFSVTAWGKASCKRLLHFFPGGLCFSCLFCEEKRYIYSAVNSWTKSTQFCPHFLNAPRFGYSVYFRGSKVRMDLEGQKIAELLTLPFSSHTFVHCFIFKMGKRGTILQPYLAQRAFPLLQTVPPPANWKTPQETITPLWKD